MPEQVQYTVKAQEVRKGDAFESGEVVVNVVTKTKYTHLHTGQRVVVLEKDSEVVVVREEPTEEERLAAQVRYIAENARQSVERSQRALEAALAKLNEASKWGHSAQWGPVGTYTSAVCEHEVWATVTRYHDNILENGLETDDDRAWWRAVAGYAREAQNALVGDRYRGSSTNWVSNGMEADMRSAVSNWLRWTGASAFEKWRRAYPDTLEY